MRPSPRRLAALAVALAAALAFAALGGLRATLAQGGAPGTPTLLAPANGALDVSPTLTLSWSQPAGAIPGTTVYNVLELTRFGGHLKTGASWPSERSPHAARTDAQAVPA